MSYDELDDDDLDYEDNLEQTYLTFAVGEEEYAIPVAHVTEIVRLQKIFPVPDVAKHVRGVINLRGKVIPLLDVRMRFGLPGAPYNDRTVIVVAEVVPGVPTGLVVDGVYDIVEFPPATIEPSRKLTSGSADPLVVGMCKAGDRVAMLLSVERLIDEEGHTAALAAALPTEPDPTHER